MYTENFMSVMVMPISVISDLKNKLQNNNALFISNSNTKQNVKTKKINNILDISKNYDYYFFDAYGVFWDGSKIMTNVIDEMEELKKQGKKVVILSNTTQLHDKAEASYAKRGLLQGKHYDLFVTSGDVFKSKVLDGSVKEFITNSSTNKTSIDNPKIYVHGAPNAALFEGSNFEITKNLDEADAVYLSIPQYTQQELEELGLNTEDNKKYLKKSNLTKAGQPERWDSVNFDIFKPFLDKCLEKQLPILNANPDASAPEKERGTEPVIINDVVRNGQLTAYYRENGGQVFECGKPNLSTYEYAVEKLAHKDKSLSYLKSCGLALKVENQRLKNAKDKMLMIGDTIATDVKGAKTFGIHSALVATGNFYKDNKNKTKEEKEEAYLNSTATYFVSKHSKPAKKTFVEMYQERINNQGTERKL